MIVQVLTNMMINQFNVQIKNNSAISFYFKSKICQKKLRRKKLSQSIIYVKTRFKKTKLNNQSSQIKITATKILLINNNVKN